MLAAIDVIKFGLEDEYYGDETITVDFSPAGDCLVTASSGIRAVRTRNLNFADSPRRLEETRYRDDEDFYCGLCFSPDGRYLAAGGYSEVVQVWDFQSGEEVKRFETSFTIKVLQFSPDGRLLAVAGDDSMCKIWGVDSGGLVGQLDHEEMTWLSSVSFSHDDRLLVTAGDDGSVRVWDTDTLSLVRNIEEMYTGDERKAVFAPYGSYVAICDSSELTLRDARSGEVQWEADASEFTSLAFDPSGAYVASGATEAVQFWNAETGALEGELVCQGTVNDLSFSRCRNWLAAAGTDFLYLWQLGGNRMTIRSGRFKGAVASVTVEAHR